VLPPSLSVLACPRRQGPTSARVHVMDDLDITDSCKAKLGSPVAQRILRTCPGGTFCFIEMPLGDKARDKFDGRRLITRIDSISRSN
jgi:hypothetical protein